MTESFAHYLAECPTPVEGWPDEPQALRMRAVLYVQRHALADGRSAYVIADEVAAAWLRAPRLRVD